MQIRGRPHGPIVDAVDGIVSIDCDGVQPPPDRSVGDGPPIIDGIATVDGRMVLLLAPAQLADGGPRDAT